nr:hypothetical protein [Marinicella sp. W31]MDC2876789.1 hypothetical protein [Marinicella sp. W31]
MTAETLVTHCLDMRLNQPTPENLSAAGEALMSAHAQIERLCDALEAVADLASGERQP